MGGRQRTSIFFDVEERKEWSEERRRSKSGKRSKKRGR